MSENLRESLPSPLQPSHSNASRVFSSVYGHDISGKILIIGSPNVGKSSMLGRFTESSFDPSDIGQTSTAFNIVEKHIRLQNEHEGKV